MADNRSIILEADKSCSGTTSFTDGHMLFDSSEKDRFILREARRNPRAVINRLIRQGGEPHMIERLIVEFDLEDEFDVYLETA